MSINNSTSLNTPIRSFFSVGFSSIMISLFNTNLSFRFYPYAPKNGERYYDMKRGLTMTVNYEGATALYIVANNIIDGKDAVDGSILTISGAGQAKLILERRPSLNVEANNQKGQMETFFVINKSNITIPFKFNTFQIQIKENGQLVTKTIETGLGAFAKTIEGYLTGINADRHLNKLLDLNDYDKYQDEDQQTNYTYDSAKENKINNAW